MPPRHTYWTILFGDKPTAFRSATQEELLPTFKQIQAKHPDAVMMWFARGRLWRSEEEARAAFERPRFDRPKPPGPKPAGDWRDKPPGGPRREPKRPFGQWTQPGGHGDARPRPPQAGEGGDWRNRGPRPPAGSSGRPPADRPREPRPSLGHWPKKTDSGEGAHKPRSDERGQWRDRDKKAGYGGAPPKPAGGDWKNRGPRPPSSTSWQKKPGHGAPPPRPRSDEGPNQGHGNEPRFGHRPKNDGGRADWQDRDAKSSTSNRWPKKPGHGGPPPKPRSDEGGDWRNRGPKQPAAPWPKKPGFGGAPPKPRRDDSADWKNRDSNRSGPGPRGDAPKGDTSTDRRGRDWRPGGQHKDPRDRFKVPRDVKRARFKDKLRRERGNPARPPKKKDDE